MTVVAPGFYYRLPALAQDLLVTAMGAAHRWRRNDPGEQRRFLEYLRAQDLRSAEQRQDAQWGFLRETLRHGCREIPYVQRLQRDVGFEPDDVRSLEDLARLPILTKAQVKDNPGDFLPRNRNLRGTVRSQTSGTTGTPMTSWYSRTAFARQWACVSLLREWHGVSDGLLPHRIQLTGSPVLDPARSNRRPFRWNHAARTMVVPVNAVGPEAVGPLLEAIRNWGRAEVMEGYPSALYSLALLGKSADIEGPQIPLMITTAEKLTPTQRVVLQEYFGGRVVDQYAFSEPGVFVGECEKGKLHLFPESGLMELLPLEGKVLVPGGLARIVTTSFHNTAQILLRYDTGDLARVAEHPSCECGRETLTIDSIEGRQSDLLRIETGSGIRYLTPALLSTAYYGFPAIFRGQIVQVAPGALDVSVELTRPFGEDEMQALLNRFGVICGTDLQVTIRVTDEIPLGAAGKFRAVIPWEGPK